jgi:autotransporter-associated beta strand protein
MRARFTLPRFILATSAVALTALYAPSLQAASFTWVSGTNFWNVNSAWTGNAAPAGNNNTDILSFAGDTGVPYTSVNNVAANPFILNRISLNATGALQANSHFISSTNPLAFSGTTPQILQNGAGSIALAVPVRLDGNLTFGGNGVGLATFNETFSGVGNITKEGTSTFRFGTRLETVPSDNTWLGRLQINGGTFRFNNNADSGRTALRANPVLLSNAGATFSCNSEMRFGALSGTVGTVQTTILDPAATNNVDSESIIITTFADATYSGTLKVSAPIGSGGHNGELIVRGTGTQTLAGNIFVDEDIVLGRGATLVLAGNASFAAVDGLNSPLGSVILGGGTLRLENETTNNQNRLRNGGLADSTAMQPIGGGTVILSGNSNGTEETTGRLQLGAGTVDGSKPRAGHLNIELIHRAGSTGVTSLGFQNYSRDQLTMSQFTTVSFSATNDSVNPQFLLLGQTGNAPRVNLTDGVVSVPLLNGLLNVTAGADSVGWATVVSPASGLASASSTVDFATYTANGVAPVTTVDWNTATNDETSNVRLSNSQSTPSTALNFAINSLKIAPVGISQTLTIAGAGHLDTSAILHAGSTDYTIRSTGGGGLRGTSTRFVHVEKAALNIDAGIAIGGQALVKSGAGVLVLNNETNDALNNTVVVNGGVLRATPGTSLPSGELRLRGGVLEIRGGTFARNIGLGQNSVNLSGVTLAAAVLVPEVDDRGSGGFAAFGGDATVTLNGGAVINWENPGFARSGHALILNSATATSVVNFTNPINLTSVDTGNINYNAREIRVLDNPSISTDSAIISGVISAGVQQSPGVFVGGVQQDLLKTGDGTLELTATNTYQGNTQIREGRLMVTGSIASSSATVIGGTGVLAGTGTAGNILLEGGSLEPGKDGIGTLNVGTVYWRSGTVKIDLGTGTTSDQLSLGTGRLVKEVNGSGPYTFDFGGTGEGGRTYVLANFGTTTFIGTNFTAANLRSGLTGTFAIAGGELRFSTNLPQAVITPLPATQRVNIGGTATYTAETSIPGAYTYQWFRNDEILTGETSATLTLSGLDASDNGNYKVEVYNGVPAQKATSNVSTLTVNEAPTATPETVAATEDVSKPITLAGTDPNNGDSLTFSVLTQPQNGELTGTLPNLIYTPNENFNGADSFTFRARDGLLDSGPATVTINVASVNDAPTAVDDSIVSGVATNIISNDTDPENNSLTLQSAENGAFGTVAVNGNTVTYTPGAGFSLSDSFTYVVSDGNGGTDSGTVTVRLGAAAAFGITAKGLEVGGEPAGTFLSKVSQPGLSDDGKIAFVGTYLKPDRKSETALFVGNPPTPVLKAGVTTAPNSALTFAKFGAVAMNANGDVAFKASLTKAPAGTAEGIWARSDAGVVRLVAQGKMSVPGITGATFTKFGDVAMPDDGRAIFAASMTGVLSTADSGIWRETGGGSIAPVIREGDTIAAATPDNGGVNRVIKTFAVFGPSEKTTLGQRRGFNNGGDVVARLGYLDKTSAIVRFNSGGTKDVIWRTGAPLSVAGNALIKSFGLPVVADDGTVTVQATLLAKSGNPAVTSSNDVVLIRRTLAGMTTLLAREGSAAVNVAGSSFKSFSDPVGGDATRAAFIGTLKAKVGGVLPTNDVGIWRHNMAGTVLEQIAREGVAAPGVSGANFSAFKSLAWTGTGDAGTAFVATLKGINKGTISAANDAGLWAEDSVGDLVLAFREGQSVGFGAGQKIVKTFTVLGPVLGALGQGGSTNFVGGFAVLATFTDRSTGVVTVWVP